MVSADATTTTIGGLNWSIREYCVVDPIPFIHPFLPLSRADSHINELEYLVEIMRTVIWSHDDANLILCGVTDNTTANSWITNGKPRRGAGLQSTRTFHLWLLKQKFRFFSSYSRSGPNMSGDFLPIASEEDIADWATGGRMARINPMGHWGGFCTFVPPAWKDVSPRAPPVPLHQTYKSPNGNMEPIVWPVLPQS